MNNIKNKIITTAIVATLLTGGLVSYASKTQLTQTQAPASVELNVATKTQAVAPKTTTIINEKAYTCVRPLEVVANPNNYLNKNIKFRQERFLI